MSRSITITPAGRLLLSPDAQAAPQLSAAMTSVLEKAFAASSAEGLLCLASKAMDEPLPAALVFWRAWASLFFHALCGLGEEAWLRAAEAGVVDTLPLPDDDELERRVAEAPPMHGLEYLTADLLRGLWRDLGELSLRRAAECAGGPQAFLQNVNPVWRLLGRVTFHLAENKRDAARPFAFLATYTHRMGADARLKHLPLAEALKQYASEKDQARLAALLAPVRQAAEHSTLVRELLESRALFQPQAWSIAQAHRFLSDVSRMEDSGLVVRVPDWWNARRPVRPEVQVRIGQQASERLGADSLLDFSIELSIDGEPLTDAERRQILAATEGLVLLRGRWVEVNGEKLEQALEHWRRLEEDYAEGIDFIHGMRLLAGAALDGDPMPQTPDWTCVSAGDWLRR